MQHLVGRVEHQARDRAALEVVQVALVLRTELHRLGFLAAGGLDVTLGPEITHFGIAIITERVGSDIYADFTWNGTLSLTYSYDPAVSAPGVPEPAAWIAMLLGFGATGTALRRRRRIACA